MVLLPPFDVHEAVSWVVSLVYAPSLHRHCGRVRSGGPPLEAGTAACTFNHQLDAIEVEDPQASHRPAPESPSEFCRCRPTFATSQLLFGNQKNLLCRYFKLTLIFFVNWASSVVWHSQNENVVVPVCQTVQQSVADPIPQVIGSRRRFGH